MKKITIGLISGLSFTIICFGSAIVILLIFYYALDVRAPSWSGVPYVEVVIYYFYLIPILGFFLAIGFVRFIFRLYSEDQIRSTLLISLANSFTIVVSSWVIVYLYLNNNFNLVEMFPAKERYNLKGYNPEIIKFVFLGIYLYIIQIATSVVIQYRAKMKD